MSNRAASSRRGDLPNSGSQEAVQAGDQPGQGHQDESGPGSPDCSQEPRVGWAPGVGVLRLAGQMHLSPTTGLHAAPAVFPEVWVCLC